MENKICVYAICKNESKFVEKWLDNMSEADYIVVLDTGSTDSTYKTLKKDPRVTRVEQQKITPWRFDVARNESMKLIPDDANILVCTDFDELFVNGWADKLRKAWKEDTTRCFYPYAWSHNQVGEPTDIFMYDKIHTRDYHWKYAVHEVLDLNEGFTNQVAITINDMMLHHYPDLNKSRSSYFELLKLSAKEYPDDSHVRVLYAREFVNLHLYKDATREYLECLTLPDIELPNRHREKLSAILTLAKLYTTNEMFDEALKYFFKFIECDNSYCEPYFGIAEIFNKFGMYTAALGMIEDASKKGYQHFDWVEDANTYLNKSDDILSICYYNLGDVDEAIAHVDLALKHSPNDIRLLKNYCCFLKKKLDSVDGNNQKSDVSATFEPIIEPVIDVD